MLLFSLLLFSQFLIRSCLLLNGLLLTELREGQLRFTQIVLNSLGFAFQLFDALLIVFLFGRLDLLANLFIGLFQFSQLSFKTLSGLCLSKKLVCSSFLGDSLLFAVLLKCQLGLANAVFNSLKLDFELTKPLVIARYFCLFDLLLNLFPRLAQFLEGSFQYCTTVVRTFLLSVSHACREQADCEQGKSKMTDS